MKILHINCSDSGSTGKIILDISRKAKEQGHTSFLCTPSITQDDKEITEYKTSFRHEQGLYRRIAVVLGFRYGFAPFSTRRILKVIKKVNPDVVHLHSVNCNMVNIYKLVGFLKKRHIPTVVTNHAEFFYTGSCAHAYPCEKFKTGCGSCENYRTACVSAWDSSDKAWKKMKAAFEGFNEAYVVSVSPYVYSRSAQSPIFDNISQTIVLNGINTEVFHPTDKPLMKPCSDDTKLIVCVTACFDPADTADKGGAYLVELARRFQNDNVRFSVVGRSVGGDVELPENLTRIGEISDQKLLAQYYSAADLCVITSRRETFSMPVAESLSCGTPLVGFYAGGPESIAIDEYCKFADFGDVDALESVIRNGWLEKKREIGAEKISAAAAAKYSGEVMAQHYIDLYKEVISKNENRNTDFS